MQSVSWLQQEDYVSSSEGYHMPSPRQNWPSWSERGGERGQLDLSLSSGVARFICVPFASQSLFRFTELKKSITKAFCQKLLLLQPIQMRESTKRAAIAFSLFHSLWSSRSEWRARCGWLLFFRLSCTHSPRQTRNWRKTMPTAVSTWPSLPTRPARPLLLRAKVPLWTRKNE